MGVIHPLNKKYIHLILILSLFGSIYAKFLYYIINDILVPKFEIVNSIVALNCHRCGLGSFKRFDACVA